MVAVLLGGTQALAQTGDNPPSDRRYFPETGHTVSGEFLKTYNSATDPELIYGYPITPEFERDFRIIQYFERARFELHPDNPPELRVVISPLGYLLHEPSTALPSAGSIPGCKYFPESGFYVCYDFLAFFEANGGAAQFGYPISNYEFRNGRMVQNYQRARFEWHPEAPGGPQIRLADLGKEYFILKDENPKRLLPSNPPPGNDRPESLVKNLQIHGYFAKGVTHSSGDQILYVILQDQKLDAVADAEVLMEISVPSGAGPIIATARTNKYGIIAHPFSFSNQPTGAVKVKITAIYHTLRKETGVSFLIWR